jgi:ATP-dependent Clp protease protease subunit
LVLLCINILGVTETIVEPEEDARLHHHLSVLRDPDETPENPDAPGNGDRSPAEGVVNELESRLFKGRKVMVFGQITDKLARDVVSRVLALVDESAKPIQIYVNSPGGHVESGDSIHDIIKFVRSTVPIYMIGTGWVASAGALIYLAGEKKTRFCLPNTRFLLHQPMGGARGPATDIEIEARELIKMHERWSKSSPPRPDSRSNESARTPTGTIVGVRGDRVRRREQDHQLNQRSQIAVQGARSSSRSARAVAGRATIFSNRTSAQRLRTRECRFKNIYFICPPTSLDLQSIFVPETFRGRRQETVADRAG